MLVSVIIPIYNISPYLRACLDSCINQTYRNLEIICVDDGSTDNCGQIVDEYAHIDSRFRVIHKINEGLPSARKSGIDVATGEYIFHLDGDDNIPVDAISDLVKIAIACKADLIIGDYYAQDPDGNRHYVESRIKHSLNGREYLQFILKEGLFNIWGKLIRRTLYTDHPIQIPPTIAMAEDLVAMTQLAYYAESVALCKSATYNYYVRTSSMSITNKHIVGELTDRTIYAVDFITRFLAPRSDSHTLELLSNYVKHFLYEYLQSPYSVAMRRNELKVLCQFIKKYKPGRYSFREFVCQISYRNLWLAKAVARLRFKIAS